MNMTTANIYEIKARLSHYARLVKAGKTVILCERNKPFAEIRPLPDPLQAAPKRKLGQLKGTCPVESAFFEADQEIQRDFERSEVFPGHTP